MRPTTTTLLTIAIFLCSAIPANAVTISQQPGMTGPAPTGWEIGGTSVEGVGRATLVHDGVTQYVYAPGNGPVSLTEADGAVWIANASAGDSIDRFANGALTRFPLRDAPVEIVAGPEGDLWFTDVWPFIGKITTSGELTEYALPTDSQPYGLVVGPDGAIWFTEQIGAIGRITTNGEIEQYPIPGHHPEVEHPTPTRITAAPGDELTFVDPGDKSTGTVTMAGVVTEHPQHPKGGRHGKKKRAAHSSRRHGPTWR